ncbi:FAD-binding protein [Slackia exigua]|uniref:FAD-binding protein n=1 Tax=Slackia exigua TaxID=84109 RepID=UPI0023F1F699|nr:FAD-binding protein [Slackia exigua]
MAHRFGKELSRRNFLTGAAVIGAGAALAGCSSPAADDAEVSAAAGVDAGAGAATGMTSSFMTPPKPVDESSITSTVDTDVVVIGAGVSGLCLGARLAELGADFKVFAAGAGHVQRGGSFHGIDTSVQHAYGITNYTPDTLGKRMKQEIMCGSSLMDQTKWSKWVNNNTEAMNWLIDKAKSYGMMVVLEDGYQDEDGLWDFTPASHNFVLADESKTVANGGIFSSTVDFGALSGASLVNDMYQHEIEQVSSIDFRTKAEYLEKNDAGRVTGVIAQKLDGDGKGTGEYVRYNGKKAVVLATGDFSLDHEMMKVYCPWVVENGMLSDWDLNYDVTFQFGGVMPGDGQKMGLWAGAAWQKTPNACVIDMLTGPYHKAIGNVDTINLNKAGKRFMNEDTMCAYSALATLQQPDHEVFYVWPVEYANAYEEWDQFGSTIANPEDGVRYPAYRSFTSESIVTEWDTQVEGKAYVKGGSIKEVLEALGDIDVDAALETIDRYNGYCADGYDPEFLKNAKLLLPIESESGVYYGMKVTAGPDNLLGSTGGLRTNVDMQVCDKDDKPIEGLYNVGVMVGDMYANTYNFCICGHNLSATCTTFPYLLAKDLADMK